MTVNHYATTRNRMRISIAPKLICALLVTTGLTSTVAFAQSETAESSDAQLQDIVVTAQRRSERLQDTPVAVSAFNAEALQSSGVANLADLSRSEEHTSELQSLMRISYAVFCLKKKKNEIKNYQIKDKINNTTRP